MDSKDNNKKEKNNTKLEQEDGRKRGEILYYTISQVATLLEQKENTILYFTNVFDDILNIKISDKELTYTDKDIDKLEFLINLKNKGLSIKEIQKYCEGLSFDIEKKVAIPKENTSTSADKIIETISHSQSKQFDNLKQYIDNKFKVNNELFSKEIIKLIEEKQKKDFELLKEDILNEINSKFDKKNNNNESLDDKIYTKIEKLLTEKFALKANIKSEFEKLNEMYISREKNIIDEIKKYRTIMAQAYCIEQEVNKGNEKPSFLSKIFTSNASK